MKCPMDVDDEVNVPVVDVRPKSSIKYQAMKLSEECFNLPKPVVFPVEFAFGVVAIEMVVEHLF